MNRSKNKKQVFCSTVEFEKKYFPKSFAKKNEEKLDHDHTLVISLVKESLDLLKRQLSK